MTIKEAMSEYFRKLKKFYNDSLGTEPSVSWDGAMEQQLFVSGPDEEGEAQWRPALAKPISTTEVCKELCDFYSSFYYWQLSGKYKGINIYFPAVCSLEAAEKVIEAAVADGNYYFKGQDVVLLANCEKAGNDDLLLFYRQHDKTLFLYDTDKRFVHNLDISLIQLIRSMEVIL